MSFIFERQLGVDVQQAALVRHNGLFSETWKDRENNFSIMSKQWNFSGRYYSAFVFYIVGKNGKFYIDERDYKKHRNEIA